MNKQLSDSEIDAMKRSLLAAFAIWMLLVIAFCFALSHAPANPCLAPMSMSGYQPPCKLAR